MLTHPEPPNPHLILSFSLSLSLRLSLLFFYPSYTLQSANPTFSPSLSLWIFERTFTLAFRSSLRILLLLLPFRSVFRSLRFRIPAISNFPWRWATAKWISPTISSLRSFPIRTHLSKVMIDWFDSAFNIYSEIEKFLGLFFFPFVFLREALFVRVFIVVLVRFEIITCSLCLDPFESQSVICSACQLRPRHVCSLLGSVFVWL